jgi:GNAT superfamily N-acetyltransferase
MSKSTSYPMSYPLRLATAGDADRIAALIARSIRALGTGDYTPAQIEAALLGTFGLDTALVRDASYFVADGAPGELAACGGWSRRRTLFGSDARPERDESLLDPAVDPARIRAFFVDPAHVRRGLGRALIERCETEARRAGFRAMELMATLPGVPLYEACGYRPGAAIDHPLPGGLHLRLVPMRKRLA